MPKAHIRQKALRVRLNIRPHMVALQEFFLEWLNGKIKRHGSGVDRRLNNTLNIKGQSEDRLFEASGDYILGKSFMIKNELICIDTDVCTDLRILRHKPAQALFLLMGHVLCVELIRNPFEEALRAAPVRSE